MDWALEVAPWAQACVGEGGCVGLGVAPGRTKLISGVLLSLGGAVSSGLEHAELSCRLAAGVLPLSIAGLWNHRGGTLSITLGTSQHMRGRAQYNPQHWGQGPTKGRQKLVPGQQGTSWCFPGGPQEAVPSGDDCPLARGRELRPWDSWCRGSSALAPGASTYHSQGVLGAWQLTGELVSFECVCVGRLLLALGPLCHWASLRPPWDLWVSAAWVTP